MVIIAHSINNQKHYHYNNINHWAGLGLAGLGWAGPSVPGHSRHWGGCGGALLQLLLSL